MLKWLSITDGNGKKKTPSTKTRVVQLLKDVTRDQTGVDLQEEDAKIMYSELLNLSKIVRNMIHSNHVIVSKNWTTMKEEYKRYYCMQLEQLAHGKGISIYCCKQQWAAHLVMAQTMKNKADTDKKRVERQIEREQVYS